jgi:hypothetical protein
VENEVWRDIYRLEGLCQVSNQGRIRRLGEIVEPYEHYGYYKVVLAKRLYAIHRLVARTFVPNPKRKPLVNHLDGLKLNNQASNLEWVTHQENSQHASRLGLIRKGSRHPNAVLREEIINPIRMLLDEGFAAKHIALVFGVSAGAIKGTKLWWKHVQNENTFQQGY